MESQVEKDTICCPPFEPAPWDGKVIEWENKRFISDRVLTFFYMPVFFGRVMRRLDRKVRAAEAAIPDWLCLSDHTSKWNMDLLLAVDREIPGAVNTTLTGRFFSEVYEGPFSDTGKWCNDFKEAATSKGFLIRKWFMWYTTCPKCAKKYGKNFVVIISQVE